MFDKMLDMVIEVQNMLIEILIEIPTEEIIAIFSIVMLIIFFIDVASHILAHRDCRSIIVSLGILGTFIGILIGLLGFDSSSVSDSVPKLLEGLKTAFITSIVGMILALFLSFIQKLKGEGSAEEEVTSLNKINRQLGKLGKLDKLSSIDKKLTLLDPVGESVKLLLSEISSFKDELKVNQKTLLEFLKTELAIIDGSLKEAVKTLSKGATAEIIKALESVIQDFNSKLTEQFGDNFKLLNESVLNLIEWQNTYKSSVQEFEKQLKSTTDTTQVTLTKLFDQIKTTTDATQETLSKLFDQMEIATDTSKNNAKVISAITDDYTKIEAISKKIEIVINTNQHQIENLKSHLQTFAEISEGAKGITDHLKSFSEEIKGTLAEQSKALTGQLKSFSKEMQGTLDEQSKALTGQLKSFSKEMQGTLDEQSKALAGQSQALSKQSEDTRELTEELKKELPKSLKELDKALATLTDKFANDYKDFLELVSKLMHPNDNR